MTSAALAHELDDELREELAEAGAGAPGRDQ
jgi:hypothetical protein